MIIIFENFKNKPNVNLASPEFWKMVKIANWNAVITFYKKNPSSFFRSSLKDKTPSFYEQAQNRIYSEYSFEEVKNFRENYYFIFYRLYDYFEKIWLNKRYDKFMPSDDGYSDLISSVIGKGKTFTKECIDVPNVFIKMAKNNDYVENFGYIFDADENEYWEVKEMFDPFLRDVRKYNV